MSGMSIRHIAWTRLLATASVGLALPAIAQAQSINYAELEELFGEPVTTSVTGKPQRASEAPAALVIITRDDIRRSPANDIPGLVQAYAGIDVVRSEEHTSELQSLMRTSYAVFCLKKKTQTQF